MSNWLLTSVQVSLSNNISFKLNKWAILGSSSLYLVNPCMFHTMNFKFCLYEHSDRYSDSMVTLMALDIDSGNDSLVTMSICPSLSLSLAPPYTTVLGGCGGTPCPLPPSKAEGGGERDGCRVIILWCVGGGLSLVAGHAVLRLALDIGAFVSCGRPGVRDGVVGISGAAAPRGTNGAASMNSLSVGSGRPCW
jgi:hypothetical protein